MIFNVLKVEKMQLKDGNLYKCMGLLQSVDCDNVVSIVYSKNEVKPQEKYNVTLSETDDLKGLKVKLSSRIDK